jgi:TPP-dependent pyruvate/acetoin dehydrogenase alpha subunit
MVLEAASSAVVSPDNDQLIEMLRRMVRIRLFEESVVRRTDIPGVVHTSVGMEASVVGACMALRADDYVVGNHRSHGHPIGKGAKLRPLAAELLGKAAGVNRGKGGSMHLADFTVGCLGETSIVGSGLPVATGAALGAKMQGLDRVAVCFFGDGGANQGTFHESLNLAAIWQLPVVYFCENNGYGVWTPFKDTCAVEDVAMRAAGYNMPGHVVDGQDVVAVFEAVAAAVTLARQGGGPSLIEAKTYRYHGHSGGPERSPVYRSAEEMARWEARDPILVLSQALPARGLSADVLAELRDEEQRAIDDAWAFAAAAPYPAVEETFRDMYTSPIKVRTQGLGAV